jgi:MFS transporter, DHA2 family, multidrug resistance protein
MKHETSLSGSPTRTAALDAAVLATLILVAVVANLNLSMANVALPMIGRAFDASQTTLDLVAVGYTLGLTVCVLCLGALGDRYGRKQMLLTGTALAVPASLLAAFAPAVQVLIFARLLGGLSAGMAFPTTLDIATAVWSGEARSRYVKLVSGAGIVAVALGPAVSGLLLQHFAWSSVFVVTVPLALVALVLILWLVPNGVNETAGAVDNLGRILPATLIGALALLEYADLMALVCHVSVIG